MSNMTIKCSYSAVVTNVK